MKSNNDKKFTGYILAAALWALGGGFLVAAVTKAIPKMMSKMMSGMIENMMAQMGEGDCDPVDVWQKMMGASLKPETTGSR